MQKDFQFRNFMVDDPYLNAYGKRRRSHGVSPRTRKNANPLNIPRNCCGLNATGDMIYYPEMPPPEETAAPVVTTPKLKNQQAWRYAKGALMLVGVYVVGAWLWKKFGK